MNQKSWLAFLLSLLCFSGYMYAQNWSGILAPSRAVHWSAAGVSGGIPDANWPQCGSTIVAYGSSSSPASPSTINNALSSCNNTSKYVGLGAGTFYLNAGISMVGLKNVVLRGQGGDSTFIIFSGSSAGCYNAAIALEGSCMWTNGGEGNVCDWTAGYAAGTTTITVANCGTTTPALGSLASLKVGSLLVLDQLDEASDTGQIWNCATTNVCANTIQGGEDRTNGPCNGSMCLRSQQQGVVVTAINGNQITVTPGIYMPNWRSGQKPQAFFQNTTASGLGLENLSIDATNSGSTETVNFTACYNCWVTGVRGINANRSHIRLVYDSHVTVANNYFFANQTGASVSYGAEMMGAWNSLFQNNIFQQDTDSEPSCTGSCEGNVIAYNFDINNVYTATTGFMQAGFYQHASGDAFNLWEGNIGPGYNSDPVHGTHHFETVFRNQLLGQNQSLCNGSRCTLNTIPVTLTAGSRYMNIIGNVLGTAGYHNNYACLATSSTCAHNETSIYDLQQTSENAGNPNSSIAGFCLQPACASRGDYDPQVTAYLFRWGNYDTVNNAVRFLSSEVPSGVNPYGNPVPASQTLPASFYLSSKPAWWGSVPWPAIGPDVTGGNISGVAGHAYQTPAMNCYLKTMGGPPAGTGGVLTFNANACYGQQNIPNPPTHLTATPH